MSTTVFIEEVQFVLRLQTHQALIVPVPRHFYGELARTSRGLSLLTTGSNNNRLSLSNMGIPSFSPPTPPSPVRIVSGSNTRLGDETYSRPVSGEVMHPPITPEHDASPARELEGTSVGSQSHSLSTVESPGVLSSTGSVVSRLIATAMSTQSSVTISEKRAAVWSLGHIAAASEEACKAVLCERLDLLEWLTNQACAADNFAFRGTCFAVCGLFGRTAAGAAKLRALDWDSSPLAKDVAVAVPKSTTLLFGSLDQHDGSTHRRRTTSGSNANRGGLIAATIHSDSNTFEPLTAPEREALDYIAS
eukprot:gene8225-10535_t